MPSLQVRQITLSDLAACAAIDQHSAATGTAWTRQDFTAFFAEPCRGGYVAVWEGRIVAFLLYQADRVNRRLHLVRIGVAADWQRRRVGSRLLAHIRQWLRPLPDLPVWMLVHERCLGMQCFLRANGFRATRICRSGSDGQDDCYLFEMIRISESHHAKKATSSPSPPRGEGSNAP